MTADRGLGPTAPELDGTAVTDRLHARYPEVPRARVAAAVDRAAEQLSDARVDSFLPILVERLARRDLTGDCG